MINDMKLYISILIAVCGILCLQPSFATTDEIIVTATRNAQSPKDYPGSVAVLDSDRLQLGAAVHPAELLNEVAGVNIHRNSGQEHLTAIRSPVLTGGAGAGSFLYLEDGVPLRAAGFSNINGLFEGALELAGSVEVSKGPGSVLYGSNAVHGLINILSREPSEEQDANSDILVSNGGFSRLKTSYNGSAFSGRYHLAANFAHDNGFREASGFDQQKLQMRHDLAIGSWTSKTLVTLQNLNQETAGFIKGVEAYKDTELAKSNPNPEAFRDGKSARIALHLNRQGSKNTQLYLIPYARWTDLSFRRHFVPGKALEDSGHKSLGLLASYQAATNFGSYIIGLDSEYTNGFLHEFQPGPGVFSFIQGEHFDYDVKAIVLAPYAQVNINLGADTHLSLGARADYTHFKYHNNIDTGTFGRFIRIADQQDDYFTVSPKIGITHTVTDDLTIYGRLARGARAPQITDAYSLQLGQLAGEIKPETLDALEFGLKGNLAALNLELAVFAMRKENFFFRNADGFNVVDGKTQHKGIELSFDVPFFKAHELSGGFTLADHRYAFSDSVPSPSSSITDGNQVDTAPHTIGFMQMKVSPSDTLDMALKWQHVGDYFTDPGNTKKYAGHNIYTLRGNYSLTNTISLYGRVDNLFDTAYADRADFAFGDNRYFPGRLRTLFLGIRYSGAVK